MPYISKVLGCGSYLPKKIVTNDEIAARIDTSDEWILARTGIKQRHVVENGELTSDLAFEAAKNALSSADVAVDELDLIVIGTTTPDNTFPSTAVKLQSKLGMRGGAAFDVQAVCSGFVYALSIVDSMIKSGQTKTALVVGADSMTRILDWEDRGTCILFGDGAGAFVVKADEIEPDATPERGILSTHIHSDGDLQELLYVDGGVSSTRTTGYLRMQGKEVFRHAVTNLTAVVNEALDANNLEATDIDWFVPHQANKRIIDSTAKKLGLSPEKVIVTIADHGNTSAASIPLALDAAIQDGRIKKGDLILMEAMGGGLTWGAALVRW